MHILIIPSWYPTKRNPISGVFFREQAHALRKAGHRIGVVYPERRSIKEFRFKVIRRKFSKEDDNGIVTVRTHGWSWFPKIPHGNARLLINDGLDLFELYIKQYGKPDIIHAHSMLYGGAISAVIHHKYSVPFVVTEHFSAYARGRIKAWQKDYLYDVYKNASKLITVSPELGFLLNERYGCPNALLEFVPNIVDTDVFNISNKPILKTPQFVFLNVSALTYNKGHHILLNSFAKKFMNNSEVGLWIGGAGEERRNLEQQAAGLGISQNVKFLGPLSRNQVRDAMQCCDIFVLPSLYETFGVVAIEAMACGKPVIATRCGGPECIVNDINGMLVSPNDIEGLAQAMDEMMKKLGQYDSELIRKDCILRFSEGTVTKRLMEIYQDTLDGR